MSTHYVHLRLFTYRDSDGAEWNAADEATDFRIQRDLLIRLARNLGQPYPRDRDSRAKVNGITVCTIDGRVGIAFCTDKNFCRSTGRLVAWQRATGTLLGNDVKIKVEDA